MSACPNIVTDKEGTCYCALAESSVLRLIQERDCIRVELDAIKNGHGELGRYEKLRLKNAELTDRLGALRASVSSLIQKAEMLIEVGEEFYDMDCGDRGSPAIDAMRAAIKDAAKGGRE